MRSLLNASVLLLCIGPLWGQSPVEATFDADYRVWTLNNGLVQVQYLLDGDGHFQFWNLGRPGAQPWVQEGRPYSSPITVLLDGAGIGEYTSFTLVETHMEETVPAGRRHVIQFQSDTPPALITLRVEMYAGQPFVRTSYSYLNLDEAPHMVLDARYGSLRTAPSSQPVRAFYVNQVRQSTPLMFETIERNLDVETDGVSVQGGAYGDNCTWLALRDASDHGLVLGWEFDGRGYLNAQMEPAGSLDTWGGPLNLHAPVAPGEAFETPASFVGLFEGDWDEAGYRTHRFVEGVLAASRPDDNFPYLAFDSWGYGQNLDEATLRKAADVAAQVGVELFIVDLGWARQIGYWDYDPVRFPSGLSAFTDYVHRLGMKVGLHFVPAEAAPQSPALEDNPDWTSSSSYDYFGAASLCLSNSPTQDWVRQQARGIIESYHPDWITQDGENLVKTCDKATHTHDPANSNWSNAVDGVDALVQAIRGEHPEVLWENNADGGTMSTFEAVKRYVTFGSCDACDTLPRRQAVYGMSYVFPPRFIDRYMPELPDKFTARSSMFGGPWILMQRISEWTPDQIALVRNEAAVYKSLRTLIRDGKVFHLTGRPDGASVEAIEAFHPELNRGVVFVYRPDTSDGSATIFPRGLRPDGRYQISFQESRQSSNATGADLMAQGIRVRLPSKNFAEIVYLNGY